MNATAERMSRQEAASVLNEYAVNENLANDMPDLYAAITVAIADMARAHERCKAKKHKYIMRHRKAVAA